MSTVLRLRCPAEADTLGLGERIGRVLRPGDLLCLSGELGAGKTVLVRGLAVGAGAHAAAVRSPTFVLHHVYPGERLTLHHIDLYRLGRDADLAVLDLDGLLQDGAVAVEWGELANLAQHSPVGIAIDTSDPTARVVCLEAGAPERIRAAWGSQDA